MPKSLSELLEAESPTAVAAARQAIAASRWQPTERGERLLTARAAMTYEEFTTAHGKPAVFELEFYAEGRAAAAAVGTFTPKGDTE